jgi:hypothetical protein
LRVYLPYFRSALPTIIVYLIGVVALYVLARPLGEIFGWYRLLIALNNGGLPLSHGIARMDKDFER